MFRKLVNYLIQVNQSDLVDKYPYLYCEYDKLLKLVLLDKNEWQKRVDKPYFDGSGDFSARAAAALHYKLDHALSLLGGTQQPIHPMNDISETELRNLYEQEQQEASPGSPD